MSSLEDSLHAAVCEDAFTEVTSNDLSVILVLDEHSLVDIKVDKSKVEEIVKSLSSDFIFNFSNLVGVDLLRSLKTRFSDGLVKGRFVESRLSKSRLFFTTSLVLRFHLDIRVLSLHLTQHVVLNTGDGFGNKVADDRLSCINLHLSHRLSDDSGRVLNEDISPDFVAETVVVTGDHAEVALVATLFLRSGKLDFPNVLLISSNGSRKRNGSSLHVVTVGLDEKSINRPCDLTIIAEGPGLGEFSTRGNFMLVTKALLNEASRVFNKLLLSVRLGSESTRLGLFLGFLLGYRFFNLNSIRMSGYVLELTHDLNRSHVRFSDLEHGMLRMDSFSFTTFAEIIVWADRALKADTLNRILSTSIALNRLMLNLSLSSTLFYQERSKKFLEGTTTVFFNFVFDTVNDFLLDELFRRFTIILVHGFIFRLFNCSLKFNLLASTTVLSFALVSTPTTAPSMFHFGVTL